MGNQKDALDHLAGRAGAWKEVREDWLEEHVNEPRIRLPLLKGQGPKKPSSSTEEPTGTGTTFVPGLFRLLVLFFVPGIFV